MPGETDGYSTQALLSLLPRDAILLGEQHDAADHQSIHWRATQTLAERGLLAALVLEMAEAGRSTQGLTPDTPEVQVKQGLAWNDRAWNWASYGPAIMAAVRAGVVVVGANLAREPMHAAMHDAQHDQRLKAATFERQQQDIREGHCRLLPESQIVPMTRVQIARDVSMAQTVQAQTRTGKTVLLLAGAAHVERVSGVPAHIGPLPFVLSASCFDLRGPAHGATVSASIESGPPPLCPPRTIAQSSSGACALRQDKNPTHH